MRKEGNVALGLGMVPSSHPQEQPHGVQALSSQRMGCLPVSRSKVATHRLSAAYLASPSSDHEWLRGVKGQVTGLSRSSAPPYLLIAAAPDECVHAAELGGDSGGAQLRRLLQRRPRGSEVARLERGPREAAETARSESHTRLHLRPTHWSAKAPKPAGD